MSEDFFWTLERLRTTPDAPTPPSDKKDEERVVIKDEDKDDGNNPDSLNPIGQKSDP